MSNNMDVSWLAIGKINIRNDSAVHSPLHEKKSSRRSLYSALFFPRRAKLRWHIFCCALNLSHFMGKFVCPHTHTHIVYNFYISWNSIIHPTIPACSDVASQGFDCSRCVSAWEFFHDEASLNPSEICSKAALLNYSCHLIFCWDIRD